MDKPTYSKIIAEAERGETISFDDWVEVFSPITEDDGDEANIKYFDADEAVDFVVKTFPKSKPHQHFWTLIDGGDPDGTMQIVNGLQNVNRVEVIICEMPWGNGDFKDAKIRIGVSY